MVTDEATIAVTARPMELPSWETVVNTPPARACSFFRNVAVMTRFDTLNKTSLAIGLRQSAGKAAAQYVHAGEAVAKRSGEAALRIEVMRTRIEAETRSIR